MGQKKGLASGQSGSVHSKTVEGVDSHTSTEISKLRKKKELTQKQVADYIGVREQTVAGWENGRSTDKIRKVQRLCIALKCEVDELVKEEDISYSDEEILAISRDEALKQQVRLTKTHSMISDLRNDLGMTQRRLAEKMDVTESTVANWEKERRSLDWIVQIKRLCEILDCNVEQLLPEEFIEPTDEELIAQWKRDSRAALKR